MRDSLSIAPVPGSDHTKFPLPWAPAEWARYGGRAIRACIARWPSRPCLRQWIAYFTGAGNEFKLKNIPVTGGTSITLADHVVPFGLTWGGDDTIVFGGPKGLLRLSSAGGAP